MTPAKNSAPSPAVPSDDPRVNLADSVANAAYDVLDKQRSLAHAAGAYAWLLRCQFWFDKIPTLESVSFSVESEYNDEGGYYDSLSVHVGYKDEEEPDQDEYPFVPDEDDDFTYGAGAMAVRTAFGHDYDGSDGHKSRDEIPAAVERAGDLWSRLVTEFHDG